MKTILILALALLITIMLLSNTPSISGLEFSRIYATKYGPRELESYRSVFGQYPTQAQGLMALVNTPSTQSFVARKEPAVDCWGHEYQYRIPALRSRKNYDLFSLGPDGIESMDDIGNWEKWNWRDLLWQ